MRRARIEQLGRLHRKELEAAVVEAEERGVDALATFAAELSLANRLTVPEALAMMVEAVGRPLRYAEPEADGLPSGHDVD